MMRTLKLAVLAIWLAGIILPNPVSAQSLLAISGVVDNRGDYGGDIPKNEKLEITFQVQNSVAANFQLPYDANPPLGLEPGRGISVNALFTPDNWQTVYTQPAFYFQEFDDQVKSDQEWFYPTGNYFWKVRFAPNSIGTWKYKITAEDASGSAESEVQSFVVGSSGNHGFIRVSPKDSRYFEFDDGTYFPGLGYNMNYNHVDWVNPVLSNQANFQKMNENGIQLVRIWLSQWAIFGSSWNPWYGIRNDYDGYIPRPGLTTFAANGTEATPSAQLSLVYSEQDGVQNRGNWFDACRFIGGFQGAPAVKQNTDYHVMIRYRAYGIEGPRVEDLTRYPNRDNYGFVAKVQNPNDGNWHQQCFNYGDPTNGVKVTNYGKNSSDWTFIEGNWNSGGRNFLPIFYLTLENSNNLATDPSWTGHPYVYIDKVYLTEDLGGCSITNLVKCGPNIVTKPSMEHLTYFMERNAYAFDKVVELAHQNNVFLKPVILEKNELLQNELDYSGTKTSFNNNNFYGNYRIMTPVRWYQAAWWRYLQARWGYSPNIHSWELLNEGDPWNDKHYTQTDELGKFMRQFAPDNHLVTTSTWHSFPASGFWANPVYPHVDYADIHQYVSKQTDQMHFFDTALMTYDESMTYGAKQTSGAGKPTIRGETGLTNSGSEPPTSDLTADTQGVWLHNYLWGQVNPGGLLESYWYETYHIYAASFDHRPIFKTLYNFIKDIPLNNGYYVDASASASQVDLRAWGQKDTITKRAHLWISNAAHTWKNTVDGVVITPINGTVTVSGFTPDTSYPVVWWDTYTGQPSTSETLTSNDNGELVLTVTNLTSDTAVRIGDYTQPPAKLGDLDHDGDIDTADYTLLVNNFGTTNCTFNVSGDCVIDIFDFSTLVGVFGT